MPDSNVILFKRRPAHDDPYRLWCSYWLDVYRTTWRACFWWVQ